MAIKRSLFLGAAAGLILAVAGGAAFANPEAIQKRRDGFQVFRVSAGAIKKVVDDNGPVANAVAPAEAIVATAKTQPAHFPAGSFAPQGKEKGETKAKPEIAANKADFDKMMGNLGAAAAKVASSAKAGNMDAVKADFAAMGAACGACHKAYRND